MHTKRPRAMQSLSIANNPQVLPTRIAIATEVRDIHKTLAEPTFVVLALGRSGSYNVIQIEAATDRNGRAYPSVDVTQLGEFVSTPVLLPPKELRVEYKAVANELIQTAKAAQSDYRDMSRHYTDEDAGIPRRALRGYNMAEENPASDLTVQYQRAGSSKPETTDLWRVVVASLKKFGIEFGSKKMHELYDIFARALMQGEVVDTGSGKVWQGRAMAMANPVPKLRDSWMRAVHANPRPKKIKFPKIREVAADLKAIKKQAGLRRNEELDVRLQVYGDGSWAIRVGPSDYDLDHRGWWGASSISSGRLNATELAKDLISQAQDHYYTDGGIEENPSRLSQDEGVSIEEQFPVGYASKGLTSDERGATKAGAGLESGDPTAASYMGRRSALAKAYMDGKDYDKDKSRKCSKDKRKHYVGRTRPSWAGVRPNYGDSYDCD